MNRGNLSRAELLKSDFRVLSAPTPLRTSPFVALDPESAKVKGWRHKLQRAFLGKEGTLKAEVSIPFTLLFYPLEVL